ncbi:hypothetical protein Q73_12635 [Bacillus coahuilensis m2-6]|uniref:DUF4870 domain-containing protein n=2 Tax=Bacillus coahuilensis TaxID=408580 RepID=A0A147K5W4_9BACI|nr:DUF4870 domain-containing protein [Bacillus coahuilensis]KUP05217.1 hypothetical protein Q75_13255 [Bacillus coahuilensis p1.1.43]KUP05668.1 hypothetical protein Q73_12635 [Bacillus coahuilensis m2-6]
MESNKVISSLCYFSIFFAGFIFPLIVLLISQDKKVKRHATGALVSHLIPFLGVVFIIIGVIGDISILAGTGGESIPVFFIVGIALAALLGLVITIWNVYKGIKVLL